jgi:hypothetical protein
LADKLDELNPGKRPKGRGRNKTVNLRMSQEEIDVARTLGNGNVSMGVRWAVRYAHDRRMRPVSLTTLLRSAAVLAAELESKRV